MNEGEGSNRILETHDDGRGVVHGLKVRAVRSGGVGDESLLSGSELRDKISESVGRAIRLSIK